MTTTPEFAYGSGPPKPVPPQKPEEIAKGITLLRPLSRKGHGPGLIILAPPSPPSPPSPQDNNNPPTSSTEIQNGIPSLRMKWAEEGYCVVQIQPHASSSASSSSSSVLQIAVQALQACAECEPKEKMGIVCYDFDLWFSATLAAAAALPEQIVVAAIYAHISQYQHLASSHHPPADGSSSGGGGKAVLPTIYHLAGTTSSSSATTPPPPTAAAAAAAAPPNSKIYEYASMETSSFAVPFSEEFEYATEAVSHSRNLAFVKKVMGGPYFDLELLWEEHTFYEFGSRSVENTMATMVEEPYVNHVPTVSFVFFLFLKMMISSSFG